MSYRLKRVPPQHLQDLLNQVIWIGPIPMLGAAVGGRSVIFSTPDQTLTFPGSGGSNVAAKDIVASLNTVGIAALRPASGVLYIALWKDGGLAIASGGSANTALGLATNGTTVSDGPIDPSGVVATMSDFVVIDSTPTPPGPEGDQVVDGSGNRVVDGSGNRVVP